MHRLTKLFYLAKISHLRNSYLFLLLFILSTNGCKRAADEVSNSAKISISIPSEAQFFAKHKAELSSASATINYSLFCFVANIKGGPLPTSPAQTCDIEKGLVLGSAPPGGVLSVDLTSGSGYSFEIYGLLRGSTSEACPPVTAQSWSWPLTKVYFLGRTDGIEIAAPTTDVLVNLSLPNANNNLIAVQGLPSSCSSVGALPIEVNHFSRLAVGAKILSGSGFKAYSRIQSNAEIKNLNGTNFRLKKWRVESL